MSPKGYPRASGLLSRQRSCESFSNVMQGASRSPLVRGDGPAPPCGDAAARSIPSSSPCKTVPWTPPRTSLVKGAVTTSTGMLPPSFCRAPLRLCAVGLQTSASARSVLFPAAQNDSAVRTDAASAPSGPSEGLPSGDGAAVRPYSSLWLSMSDEPADDGFDSPDLSPPGSRPSSGLAAAYKRRKMETPAAARCFPSESPPATRTLVRPPPPRAARDRRA